MGLTEDVTAALAKTVWGYGDGLPDDHIRQAGLDPDNPAIRQAVDLADELIGFPRHLSQHVGGFVLTRERLDETVPIGNAAMEERTFIEWDKDDIDTLGLMKVDVLALGMLSCLRRGLDLLQAHYGKDYSLATLPADDAAVYDMLSRADSIGVFQVESRAQMSMLPRLKPQCFYDLVIEVAIVRPGPIQGDMVHPYLRRRDGIAKEHYPSPSPDHGPADELKDVLKRTLGVPLFQEQAMQIAITAAKFTPDEADGLRRAMATFRHTGNVHLFRDKFIEGMAGRGYDRSFAEHCFGQIEGFGEYGFPESHAASFALLVYASAWIKCRYPDVFCAAILNSQPMGFYQPAQLVRDARAHGVEIREADVNFSAWDCTLEPDSCSAHSRESGNPVKDSIAGSPLSRGRADESGHAVRLGFRLIAGLAEDELQKLIAARGNGFSSIERLAAIAGVSRFTIERLAEADAFRSLGLDRRAALWAARRLDMIGIRPPRGGAKAQDVVQDSALPLLTPHLSDELFPEETVTLPAMPLCEHVVEDYVATGLSLKAHPVRFFRDRLTALGAMRNAELRSDAVTQDSAGHRRRPRSGAAAAGHLEGRRVHDAGRRDRHRQHHRLAESLRQKPPHRDDGAFPRRARTAAARRPRHPRDRARFRRSFRRTAIAARRRAFPADSFVPDASGRVVAHSQEPRLSLNDRQTNGALPTEPANGACQRSLAMCGRAKLPDDVSEIKLDLKIDFDEIGDYRPRWNAAPTSKLPVVVSTNGQRTLTAMRWGLIPSWARPETAVPQNRPFNLQRPRRKCGQPSRLPLGLASRPPLPGHRRRLLRVARRRQTTFRCGAWQSRAYDLCRPVGPVAQPGRHDAQILRHHHHQSQRTS